jgi:hypothetical protein
MNDTWIFDSSLHQWSELKIAPSYRENLLPRNGHSAIVVKDRYMVVFGGMFEITKELDDLSVLDLKE